ncbi:MAG: TolC family protein [Kiritimatiellia bacterium]|jgi:outer membrane protein TolC
MIFDRPHLPPGNGAPHLSRHAVFPGGFARIPVALLPLLALLAGCMTPDRAVDETERAASELATPVVGDITGLTNAFTIARPEDRLRARLMVSQDLPGTRSATNGVTSLGDGPVTLTLQDALRIGAQNDDTYQKLKEAIFHAALAIDLQQHAFESTFAGALGGGVERTTGDGGNATTASGNAKPSMARTFSNGATAAASLGLDVVRLLTGDKSGAFGLAGDASFSIPLLRGSGRAVNLEKLTQAQRDLLYAVHDFEAHRQSYAVSIADAYYAILEAVRHLESLEDNQQRLSDNFERAQMLADSGRMKRIEVDQARQDLLSTGNSLVSARRNLDAKYDGFKATLGLPADAEIAVDMDELVRLQVDMGLGAEGTNLVDAAAAMPPLPWNDDDALAIALERRHDLFNTRGRLEDAVRALPLARDRLRPELSLSGALGYDRQRKIHAPAAAEGEKRSTRDWTYSAGLDLDLPWERTAERNEYRAALVAIDAAMRSVETAEDAAKSLIRDDLRKLRSAWASFVIQSEAVRVAMRRVHSTDLFNQAGRAEIRDVLDAEDDLLTARNALVSAVIDYRVAGLELRRDMAVLDITAEGLWNELEP